MTWALATWLVQAVRRPATTAQRGVTGEASSSLDGWTTLGEVNSDMQWKTRYVKKEDVNLSPKTDCWR